LLGFSISNLLGLVVSPIFFLLLSIDDLNRVVSLVVLYSIFSSVICYFKHNCSFSLGLVVRLVFFLIHEHWWSEPSR